MNIKGKIALLSLTAMIMTSCGVSISTESTLEGNYASYEVYKVDSYGDTEVRDRIDEGCIFLDSENSSSITSIYSTNPEDGDYLSFEYSLAGSDLEYGFTFNSFEKESVSITKSLLYSQHQSPEISAYVNGQEFIAVVDGGGCKYEY